MPSTMATKPALCEAIPAGMSPTRRPKPTPSSKTFEVTKLQKPLVLSLSIYIYIYMSLRLYICLSLSNSLSLSLPWWRHSLRTGVICSFLSKGCPAHELQCCFVLTLLVSFSHCFDGSDG